MNACLGCTMYIRHLHINVFLQREGVGIVGLLIEITYSVVLKIPCLIPYFVSKILWLGSQNKKKNISK